MAKILPGLLGISGRIGSPVFRRLPNGDTVVYENYNNTAADSGQLVQRTVPRMIQTGTQPDGTPIFAQDASKFTVSGAPPMLPSSSAIASSDIPTWNVRRTLSHDLRYGPGLLSALRRQCPGPDRVR